MGSGIYLGSLAGADSTFSTGVDSYDYNVDVSSGETVTLTGNWDNLLSGDGPSGNGDGGYSVTSGLPSFGTFSLDSASGAMSWSFTYDDLVSNGGLDQTISFDVTGTGYFSNVDTDTVNVVITCFLGGTRIATPGGEVAVEDLRIGDPILTAAGQVVPVRWIGRQRVGNNVFLSRRKAPVRIAAGALGPSLPHSDLCVSADHGMIVGDYVVNAGAMVNGGTIRFLHPSELPAEFTYYHVETEAHDEILANGAPAETFVDYVGRDEFDNHQEYLDLYGADRIIPEMKRLRISGQRQLPQRLRSRLGIAPHGEGLRDEFDRLMATLSAA